MFAVDEVERLCFENQKIVRKQWMSTKVTE